MNPPLHILQLTNRLPWPLNDGGNLATYHVAHELQAQGNRLTLASLNTNKHWVDPSCIPGLGRVETVPLNTDLTMIGLLKGFFQKQPYNVQRFYSTAFEALLIRLLREQPFDIIQLEGSYMSLYVPVLRKYSQAKIVLRSHNVEGEIWERLAVNESNILKKIYLTDLAKKIKRFEKESLSLVDGIVAITAKDADFYKSAGYKGKLKVINAGVDFTRYKIETPAAFSPSLCFLGSLEWLPNVQGLQWFLENVWPLVVNKQPDASFHIAGKNTPAELLALQMQGVTVHGMVPDAVAFLHQYPIMVVPLLSGGGMRLKIVEGMALGKAIVSTTVGAEGIAATPGKHLLLADHARDFADAVIQLLENQTMAANMGKNAVQLANDQYNWLNLVHAFEGFYRDLLKR